MSYNSIPEMCIKQSERLKDKVASKVKRGGKWVDILWSETDKDVHEIGYGLISLGIKPGEAVALLSATRHEWLLCDIGIMSTGGVTVPIYPSNTAEEAEYIVNDSDSKFLIVENKAQLEKMLTVRKNMPKIEKIIVIEGPVEKREGVMLLDDLKKQGREKAGEYEPIMRKRVESLKREDVATIVYTSGTTGPPKGVVQTHGNHLFMAENGAKALDVRQEDTGLLFLPLAHSFARWLEYLGIYVGLTGAYAESIEKFVENMQEVKPHTTAGVPRIFEKAYATILATVSEGPPIKKKIFDWAVGVGTEASKLIQAKKPLPLGLRIKRAIAHRLVFSKIHARFGGRLRFWGSGGAPLAKEIAEFFHAIGIQILEGYGLTETCPATNVNRIDNYKFGTVGLPLPGVEVKLALDGEILAKGPNVALKGYYKRPNDTKELFTEDGWFKTGDIGEIDSEGFLKITDRKKDLIKTAGGKFVAPQEIENRLKTDTFISQAVVIGDRRPYCVALISISKEDAEKYAKDNGIRFSSYEDLTKNPRIIERVKKTMDSVNSRLASFETIKRFAIVPRDFTQEDSEITPTLKVKRKVITERYKKLIDDLYAAK